MDWYDHKEEEDMNKNTKVEAQKLLDDGQELVDRGRKLMDEFNQHAHSYRHLDGHTYACTICSKTTEADPARRDSLLSAMKAFGNGNHSRIRFLEDAAAALPGWREKALNAAKTLRQGG